MFRPLVPDSAADADLPLVGSPNVGYRGQSRVATDIAWYYSALLRRVRALARHLLTVAEDPVARGRKTSHRGLFRPAFEMPKPPVTAPIASIPVAPRARHLAVCHDRRSDAAAGPRQPGRDVGDARSCQRRKRAIQCAGLRRGRPRAVRADPRTRVPTVAFSPRSRPSPRCATLASSSKSPARTSALAEARLREARIHAGDVEELIDRVSALPERRVHDDHRRPLGQADTQVAELAAAGRGLALDRSQVERRRPANLQPTPWPVIRRSSASCFTLGDAIAATLSEGVAADWRLADVDQYRRRVSRWC